jgi:predicted O-methyltransferase YrrM
MQKIPDGVAAAKQRANRLGRTNSCVDEVGRLLSVLAAAVAPGGRILEIGTSVGVGTAWITSGITTRTDVEVTSVEVDRDLAETAMEQPWPPNVRVMNADAVEVLGALGRFDLMFVDARPVKHGHMGAALAALRLGGVLVIDDLHVHMKNNEEQKAAKEALRRFLLSRSDLHATELDWASGVILATRTRTSD